MPSGTATAFEFRHASWFDDPVFELLRGAGAALCVADSADLETPTVRTAPHGYFRLRREAYDEAALDRWAERVRAAAFPGDVHVYFKHEDEARGPALAAAFADRLGKVVGSAA